MSDMPVSFESLPSEFGQADAGLPIDLSQISARFNEVAHIESTWGLPGIPDVAKLDLITSPLMAGQGMGDFLYGLQADMQIDRMLPNAGGLLGGDVAALAQVGPALGLDRPTPEGFVSKTAEQFGELSAGWTTPAEQQGSTAVVNQGRKLFHSVTNPGERNAINRPWVFDGGNEAVMELQMRAIEAGLLPEDTPLNGIWTPSLRAARYTLMQQDANNEMKGERPGAMSLEGVGNLLDNWLSPSGLLSAAVSLEFLPDIQGAKDDWNSWGDKWREWNDDKFNAKKLLDAATGPIDEIALPILNLALLGSGIGSFGLFAVRGTQLLKAGRGLKAMTALDRGRGVMAGGLKGAKMLPGATHLGQAKRIESLQQTGFVAGKLVKAGEGTKRAAVGGKMDAWRNLAGVQTVKRATQEGMKLGVMGQLESTLFDSRNDEIYDKLLEYRTEDPALAALTMVVELPLAPMSVFMPGRVAQAYRGTKNVVGATKSVAGFGALTRNEDIQLKLIPQAIKRIAVTDPERANDLAETFKKNPTKAAVKLFTGTDTLDEESLTEAGSRMFQVFEQMAIDKEVSVVLSQMDLTDLSSAEARQMRLNIRNKNTEMIRGLPEIPQDVIDGAVYNPANADHRAWVKSMVSRRHNLDDLSDGQLSQIEKITASRAGAQSKWAKRLFSEDEGIRTKAFNQLLADHANHMEARQGKYHQLLDGVSEADVVAYITKHPETIDNIGDFEKHRTGLIQLEEWAEEMKWSADVETRRPDQPFGVKAQPDSPQDSYDFGSSSKLLAEVFDIPQGQMSKGAKPMMIDSDVDIPGGMSAEGRQSAERWFTMTDDPVHGDPWPRKYLEEFQANEELTGRLHDALRKRFGDRVIVRRGALFSQTKEAPQSGITNGSIMPKWMVQDGGFTQTGYKDFEGNLSEWLTNQGHEAVAEFDSLVDDLYDGASSDITDMFGDQAGFKQMLMLVAKGDDESAMNMAIGVVNKNTKWMLSDLKDSADQFKRSVQDGMFEPSEEFKEALDYVLDAKLHPADDLKLWQDFHKQFPEAVDDYGLGIPPWYGSMPTTPEKLLAEFSNNLNPYLEFQMGNKFTGAGGDEFDFHYGASIPVEDIVATGSVSEGEVFFKIPEKGLERRTPASMKDEWVPASLDDSIRAEEADPNWVRKQGRQVRPYDNAVAPSAQKVGLARTDTMTKQQAHILNNYIDSLRQHSKALGRETSVGEDELWNVYGKRLVSDPNWRNYGDGRIDSMYNMIVKEGAAQIPDGGSLSMASPKQLAGAVDKKPDLLKKYQEGRGQASAKAVSKSQFRKYVRSLQWLDRTGEAENLADARGVFGKRLQKILDDENVWRAVGAGGFEARPWTGADDMSSLNDLQKRLNDHKQFLAAEMDGVPPELQAKLAESGYKPVLMYEKISPMDSVGLRDSMTEITKWRMHAKTLGTFAARQDPRELAEIRRQNLRRLLPVRMSKLNKTSFDFDFSDDEIDHITNLLDTHVSNVRTQAIDSDAMGLPFTAKLMDRAKGQVTSRSMYDLTPGEIKKALGGRFTKGEIDTITGALRSARDIGFEYRGLAHLEDALVSKSWLHRGLEGFADTEAGADFGLLNRLKIRKEGVSTGPQEFRGLEQGMAFKRVAAASVGAWLGGNNAMNEGADGEWVALAALTGGVGGAVLGGKIASPRIIASFGVGLESGKQAYDRSDGDLGTAVVTGLAAGALVNRGSSAAARKALSGLDGNGWAQYSRLGQGYQRLRDIGRFSLSPVFDLQRYTEGVMLSQMRAGDKLAVTLNPSKWAANNLDYADVAQVREAYNNALKRSLGFESVSALSDALEETSGGYFLERGLAGFSSLEWEAGTWAQLVAKGVPEKEAIETARRIFTYGTTGRSALEQSVNFVFFPFSFQKKFLGDVGEFLADDLSRVTALHANLKTYEIMNEQFDLETIMAERLPILSQMRDFNPVAYGMSPGRFGGINAPLIETAMNSQATRPAIDPILNAMLPQSITIGDPEQVHDLDNFFNQSVGVIRDFRQLKRDLVDQQIGQVIFSESHLTSSAERSAGWDAWSAKRTEFAGTLAEAGVEWTDVMRAQPGDVFFPLRAEYKRQERELRASMPAWAESYDESAGNRVVRQAELGRLRVSPLTSGEQLLVQFADEVDRMSEEVSNLYSVSLLDDPELSPPGAQGYLREQAERLARQSPEFHRLYREFYETDFGPLYREIR